MRSPKDIQAWPSGAPISAGVWLDHSGVLTRPDTWLHGHRPSRIIAPHLVVAGRGRLISDHEDLILEPGDLFCLLPGVSYSYQGLEQDPWRLRWLVLNRPGAAAWAADGGFRTTCAGVRPANPAAVADSFEAIHAACGRRASGDGLRILAALYNLAAALVSAQAPARTAVGSSRDLVAEVDRAVAALGLNTTAAELARALAVSPATLLRACRAAGHRGPTALLTAHRLARAEDLLRSTDLKMAAIAQAAGFASEKYFLRRFRTCRGQTPTAFRCRVRGTV